MVKPTEKVNGGGHVEEAGDADVYSATSVEEIQNALSELRAREAVITARLDDFLASQRDFHQQLKKLDGVQEGLKSQVVKVKAMQKDMVSGAASGAKNLSSSVKRLDLEQARINATLQVVDQVAELKACVLGVAGSMGAPQDWETAATYLSRASKIPPEVVNSPFAARVVPTTEVPDAPNITLQNTSNSLCGLFLREFDKAIEAGDQSKITRFFKLFPLIGKPEVGLDVYGRFVCQGVASRARSKLNAGTGGAAAKDGFFFANALTGLFEHIAQIVDGHGNLVERHYGRGKLLPVIELLQREADQQGGIILDTWTDERRVDRKLTDIKSYAFTFLVQSFLPIPRGSIGTPRSGSPAERGLPQASEDEGVNMKEIDAVLNEMVIMLGKWTLYTRFLQEKCAAPDAEASFEVSIPLNDSSLSSKLADRVKSPFNVMTTFFFRRSVEKAFQLDEQPPQLSLNPNIPLQSSPPHISSAVDDIMYIVNKVLQQSIATRQREIVSSVVPMVSRVMGADFLGMIQRKMRDESYPKAAVQGALPPENTIIAFIVLINNICAAIDYIKQIVRAQLESLSAPPESAPETARGTFFPALDEQEAVDNTLSSFESTFEAKAGELLNDSVQVIFNNVMKSRLRPILLDAFRDIDYQLTQEEIQEHANEEGRDSEEEADLVRRRFQHGWDALARPISRLMNSNAFDKLLATTISFLSKLLEKKIWTYQGRVNELGAVRLERDVHQIAIVIVQGRKYGYRDAFTKCTQICMVMNMEEEEWEELQANPDSGADVADRLTVEERLRARSMVRDAV